MTFHTIWNLHAGSGPIIATAIHNGHTVRDDVLPLMAISEIDRLREEDPFTGQWAGITDTHVIGLHSRFEIDLNRPREKAVYLTPDDAWGLQVWHNQPPVEVIKQSLLEYDAFYAEMRRLFSGIAQKYGRFVVLDLHTYNHRRQGPHGPITDPALNPEVNVGTRTMPSRDRWTPVVEQFKSDLQRHKFLGRHLDVRENVKFGGGHFARWLHTTFPNSACVLSIEFKKFFMDEWTGHQDPAKMQVQAIRQALQATLPGINQTLNTL